MHNKRHLLLPPTSTPTLGIGIGYDIHARHSNRHLLLPLTLTLTPHSYPGIGLGMIYLPAIVSVTYYFEKKRAFATGLAVCGSGIGTFIFAPLLRVRPV